MPMALPGRIGRVVAASVSVMNRPQCTWTFPLWRSRREGAWLLTAAALFAALDVLVSLTRPPTTQWAGPHAGLILQLSVDAALLFAVRFPAWVGGWVVLVAVLMLVSDAHAPGLFTVEHSAAHTTTPFVTPVIAANLVRLLDRRLAFVLIGLLAALGSRFWAPTWDVTPYGLLNTVVPLLAVLYVDARRQLIASLRERAERAEREQRLLAEQARAQERRRLAEEMHDVVSHQLSLVVLHAGALGTSSTEAVVRRAAEDIRQAGVQALTELRDLVGVLREPHAVGAVGRVPEQAAAPDVTTLIEEARAVGERILHTASGDPDLLSSTIRRTVYRVVQESLTNARKHAPGAEVRVALRYGGDGAAVRVTNDAIRRPPDAALAGSGCGVGLQGLRHRVELNGGTLRAAPRSGGGFEVDAILPAYVPTGEDGQPRDPGHRRR